jgi:hypothetical protein
MDSMTRVLPTSVSVARTKRIEREGASGGKKITDGADHPLLLRVGELGKDRKGDHLGERASETASGPWMVGLSEKAFCRWRGMG